MSLFSAMADERSEWAQSTSLFSVSSPLNDLLDKDDFTLEQVLQEDELVQEVKTRNTKLIDFLSQELTVQRLVEYVVCASEDKTNDLRTLKYPFMACEVICCDIASITETLVTASDGNIVETLFEFLYETDDVLDPRLAGYFEKIVTMLMVRKPHEMTTLLNRNSDKLLAGFARHAASFSVSELLKRLLQPDHSDSMDDCMDFPGNSTGFSPSHLWYAGEDDDGLSASSTPTASKDKTLMWQLEPKVVDLLLDTLTDVEADSDAHKHVSEVLVDIIHCGTRAQRTDPASPASSITPVSFVLLEYLETKEVAEKLVALAVPADDKTAASCMSSMTGAISVLSALLSRATNSRYCATDEVPPAVMCTIERLPQICAILEADEVIAGSICNQRHQEVPRLGLRRLKMVGLIVLLMQSKYQKVDLALLEHHAIGICLDLFFKFELVNMLHADVENMVIGILKSGSHNLLVGLVKEARLLPRIVEAHEKNGEATAVAKGFSLGYVGHLHRICNTLMTMLDNVRGSAKDEGSLNKMRHADTVLELFEEDETTWKKWEELSTKVLAPIYERERLPLGGATVTQGGEDPYSGMSFNQNDELLNAQFVEMLGASGFGADVNGFDTDFDAKDIDTPMLPEIMNDSSSSEEEDEVQLARQESGRKDTESCVGADRWASCESNRSWAKFEGTFEDIPFEPIPGMEDDDFDDDEPIPPIVTTADLAANVVATRSADAATAPVKEELPAENALDVATARVEEEPPAENALDVATARIEEEPPAENALDVATAPVEESPAENALDVATAPVEEESPAENALDVATARIEEEPPAENALDVATAPVEEEPQAENALDVVSAIVKEEAPTENVVPVATDATTIATTEESPTEKISVETDAEEIATTEPTTTADTETKVETVEDDNSLEEAPSANAVVGAAPGDAAAGVN